MYRVSGALLVPGPQTKRHPEKGGKLNTSQAGSVAASRAAVGQFLSISREAFILRTRYSESTPFFLSEHFPPNLQGLYGGKGRLMPRIIDDVDVDAVAAPAKSFLLSIWD